jgi:hypothetical protein
MKIENFKLQNANYSSVHNRAEIKYEIPSPPTYKRGEFPSLEKRG